MRLVGLNQLIESVSSMIFASYVGNWLDKTDRKKGTLTVLAFNNISVAISAALLAICLTISQSSILYTVCLTLSIFFCALSKCASEGEKMVFTKDWVVVMVKNEAGSTLSRLNPKPATLELEDRGGFTDRGLTKAGGAFIIEWGKGRNAIMTTIDQLSSVIAPILTGFILQFSGHRSACFVFVFWNLLSWILERYLLSKVYAEVPALAIRQKSDEDEPETHKDSDSSKRTNSFSDFCGLFGTYFRQSVFPAAFGLALLYMTVLGFDGLAISHGKAQGVSEDVLGAFRSVGSLLGILGACSYTYVERKIGVRKTGLLGLILQQSFLWLCVLSIFLPGSPFDPVTYAKEWTLESWLVQFKSALYMSPSNTTFPVPSADPPTYSWSSFSFSGQMSSIITFFLGITLARFGLWIADLSITQVMQENIPEKERNTVFGVQNALCQFFSVLKDIVVILLPDERTFGPKIKSTQKPELEPLKA
ncbi:hypothetical protein FO519_006395 [Halicephalobus sp. NKZ332]|nr:hypothetical protein FO519_006395 [Halicephalobus sp. NKZ332]